MTKRRALLAGQWYPADPVACRKAVEVHVGEPEDCGALGFAIAPHAGWAYSGDVAGSALGTLHRARPEADVVVVFGSHRGPDGPNTAFVGEGWETPLGELSTERGLAAELAGALSLSEEPVAPRRADNAVELLLPFVKHLWPRARYLMFGVAASEAALAIGCRVGEALEGRDAVFVGSTDLTHYGPNYRFTPKGEGPEAERWVRAENDAGFLLRLTADDLPGAITHARANGSACCPGAASAAVEAARAHRERVQTRLLSHTLSSDVRTSTSFVGYAGLVG